MFFLSTTGYETKRFNNLINNKLQNLDKKVTLDLKKIKLKLDLRKMNFFLSTKDLEASYDKTPISFQQVKIYFDLNSLLKRSPRIKNLYLNTKVINADNFKKLVLNIKPSNFKSFILNNLNDGMIKINLNSNFDKDFTLQDYQIDGYVRKISGTFFKDVKVTDTNFIFSINQNEGNLDKLNGKINGIPITNGNLKLIKDKDIVVNTNFKTKLDLTHENLKNKLLDKNLDKYNKNEFLFKGNLNHNLNLTFNNTYKLKDYKYVASGKANDANFKVRENIQVPFLKENFRIIFFENTNISVNLNSSGKKIIKLNGFYKLNSKNLQKFDMQIDKNLYNLDIELNNEIIIPIINYTKLENVKSKIKTNFKIKKNFVDIKKFVYTEKDNLIDLNSLRLDKNGIIESFNDITVKTSNNDFKISKDKKIVVSGKKFDATSLSKLLQSDNQNDSRIKKFSNEIKIELDLISTGLDKKIKNFNLIGNLYKGSPIKINAKGEFDDGKFLDISLKKDKNSNKKYLEIYSDFPEPLLKEYKFFKGLSGGKMLYNSVYDTNESVSALTIEDFKVVNAPGFVKLLSLADFGGMADLVSGKGLTFDRLEINFTKNKRLLKLEELYAIGPSISVLMEGYVEGSTGLVSLRGTMVPAKNLNKFLSKIPVVGDILIPKEVGEGLFGVSFKMKGPKGKIKTTVNPIKTLTPRFIQKAIGK